jgi:hypothetical protein
MNVPHMKSYRVSHQTFIENDSRKLLLLLSDGSPLTIFRNSDSSQFCTWYFGNADISFISSHVV